MTFRTLFDLMRERGVIKKLAPPAAFRIFYEAGREAQKAEEERATDRADHSGSQPEAQR